MVKRRRERDRPKAGPESAYHPNKRVLLTYGSDEDEVEDSSTTAVPALEDRHIASYRMTEYAECDGDVTTGALDKAVEEASVETPSAADEETIQEAEEEPSRISEGWLNDAQKDRRTNQFPAVGLAEEDGAYDSTTEEAMAYLDAVKAERQAMPEVFSAARQPATQSDQVDVDVDVGEGGPDEGYWDEDGTYIGRPDTPPPAAADDELDPQRVFTASLKDKFYIQRDQLRALPSAEKLAALGEHHPISFPRGNAKAHTNWHRSLVSKPPKTAQLQALTQDTVFDLLRLFEKAYMVKGRNIKTVTSAWVWSLLAKLDDVGNMSNDQVYPLRELGKKAIFLQLHFSDPEAAAQLEALQQDEVSSPDAIDGAESTENDAEGETAKRQPSSSNSSNTRTYHATASDNTFATLDMILVVVGDIFGQRDLLEFRRPWSKTAPPEEAVDS